MRPLVISPQSARRLAVTKQSLAGAFEAPGPETILDVIRTLGCLQVDPISVVAPTQAVVLWSRLGTYDRADLDDLAWSRRALFLYWAHAASLVLTEDFPIHQFRMRRWGRGDSGWERKTRAWMADNASLRRHVLSELRRRGPLRLRDSRTGRSFPGARPGGQKDATYPRCSSSCGPRER